MSFTVNETTAARVGVATVCRAESGAQDRPPTAVIRIVDRVTDHMPQDLGPDGVGPLWMQRHRDFYRQQAEDIYAALAHALPSGTLDALLGVMALRRASILRVADPASGSAARRDAATGDMSAGAWLVMAGDGSSRTALFAVERDEEQALTTARNIGGLVAGPIPWVADFRAEAGETGAKVLDGTL